MADQFQLPKLTVPANAASSPLFTENTVSAVNASAGSSDAGKVVLLNASGQIDASMGGGGGSSPFNGITSGTNTAAVMVVGSGATINFTGSGIINASEVGGINVAGNTPAHAGQLLISQPGNATAVWADPLVQGLYPIGTPISTPINPVFIGASDGTNLQAILVDGSGNLKVAVENSVAVTGTIAATQSGTWNIGTVTTLSTITNPVAVTGTFWQTTQPVSGTVTADQGGSWTVAATQSGSWAVSVSNFPSTQAVTQSTSPWVTADEHITATLNQDGSGNVGVNIENTPAVTVSGSVAVTGTVAATQSGSWTVAATQSGTWNIGTLTSITNAVTVSQGTAANLNATVVGTGTFAVQATQSGTWNIGTITSITDTVTVSGTVAVSSITGSVAVTQDTSPWVVSNGGTFAVQAAQSGSWTVAATQSGSWSTTVTGTVAVSSISGILEVSPTGSANTASNPFFNEIVTSGGGSVFGHTLNQDGSGNVGVNVENTVSISGTISGSTVTAVSPGTYVQSAGASYTTSSTATVTLSAVVSGDTIVIGFSYPSTSTISSVVDNNGNKYVNVTTSSAINSLLFSMYYATGVFAGATTVTVTFNTPSSGEIVAAEYNGGMYLIPNATSNTGTSAAPTTGAISPSVSSRANNLSVVFVYGQAGTLVPNNTSTTSSSGKSASPRFSTSNYLIADCILNEAAQMDFTFSQASSSNWAINFGQFAILNATQIPIASATYYQKPTAWVPIGGVDTLGSSPVGGCITVQGSASAIAQPVSQNVSTAWVITPQPLTTGGWTTNWQAALSDSATVVKASQGQLGGYSIYNPNATVEFVMYFNTASPTVGTTTPIWVVPVPPTSIAEIEFVMGIAFSSSIYVLATSSVSTATAPSSALQVTSAYK